ncbi:MAG: sulfatase-like hydrolase/transferase [Gammaproteobacteria bacterium]|nr:sulfatase-like hydrolase/transferase [Gammaproteobacteria bacterium]NIP87618.1 sulfatase-like hydrolase/transferase [Gammaproteobacteria bacterium]NIR21943.1 sulfatase-like hydrolase/transferase [Gammaproteobacteria bacterium]NIS03639.1 sulfatase-like hydrolase/transferase [Gammaproteobacteria bacterium]NIU40654.1 sulfatase-like hydrolase/transferase [Gammaproteobacteria bacterium]
MKGLGKRFQIAVAAAIVAWPMGVNAIQPDGPYLAAEERFGEQWKKNDESADAKLAALRGKFGKRPNIVYILTDDIGWGELGWQGGGKHRGAPTPSLDRMAFEGMRFWSAYAEPSCTPTRIAIMTGRHPVRTGLLSVLWPGQDDGLSPEEVTVAEVLSTAGYHTAMWGKWHLGDLDKHAPENQGFDYAYYGLFNGAPDYWQASHDDQSGTFPFADFPGYEEYKARTGIDLSVAGYIGEKGKKRKPIPGLAGNLSPDRQEAFENESIAQITDWIKGKAKSDKPFFIYWASYALQMSASKEFLDAPGVDKNNRQASFMVLHNKHVQMLLDTLRGEGIAENTLVVWISDNGPMYAFWPTAGYTLLTGAKGDVTEGGVRVPAMAWWPGMIEPGQDPDDFLHVTDLYTTAARIAGATKHIPSDRVTDGIDQTALFLLGEGNSKRNYMFHYGGSVLGAIRYENFKVHIKASHGGLPGMDFFNIRRDPGEKYGAMYPGLFAVTPVQMLLRQHIGTISKFPHRPPETPGSGELTPHD